MVHYRASGSGAAGRVSLLSSISCHLGHQSSVHERLSLPLLTLAPALQHQPLQLAQIPLHLPPPPAHPHPGLKQLATAGSFRSSFISNWADVLVTDLVLCLWKQQGWTCAWFWFHVSGAFGGILLLSMVVVIYRWWWLQLG